MLGKDGPVIACGRQSLELLQLQAAGGRRLAAAVLVRQLGLRPGMRLG
jgi:methionyl-tRNA formyltransferase